MNRRIPILFALLFLLSTKVSLAQSYSIPPAPVDDWVPSTSGNGIYSVAFGWDNDDVNNYNIPTSVVLERQKDGDSWISLTGGVFVTKYKFERQESVAIDGEYRYRAKGCNSAGCGGWRQSNSIVVGEELAKFSINDVSTTEGSNIKFTVTKSGITSDSHSVSYHTVNGTAGNADYVAKSGILNFGPGQASAAIYVNTIDDTYSESAENFEVVLSGAVDPAIITKSRGVATINDNSDSGEDLSNTPPTFYFPIDNYSRSGTEGQPLLFTVEKSHVTNASYSVEYEIAFPQSGVCSICVANQNDFSSSLSGVVTFASTELQKQITITPNNDLVSEYDEYFNLILKSPTDGASIGQGLASGLIRTDDPPLPPYATEYTVPSTSGTGEYTVQFYWDHDDVNGLNHPVTAEMQRQRNGASWVPIPNAAFIDQFRFRYQESVGQAGSYRYRARGCNVNGCGGWSTTSEVLVTIENPEFSVNNMAVTEGGDLIFTVTKSGSASTDYSINYHTVNGTAGSADYVAQSGTLIFAASETSKAIVVPTVDDALPEPTENLELVLSGAVNPASIGNDRGTGTIYDNDQDAQDALPHTGIDPINDPITTADYLGQLRGEHSVGSDGSFNYSIPIDIPPGINGMQPEISLSYNSNRRNDIAGWGWFVEGLSSIHRCPADHVRDGYVSGVNNGDAYKYCLDGGRLVEIGSGEYRTESESFSRIRRFGGTERAPDYWIVEHKDGHTLTLGGSGAHQSEREDGAGKTYLWSINSMEDLSNNLGEYTYTKNSATGIHRPLVIQYTRNTAAGTDLNHRVSFIYESNVRPDPVRKYIAGGLWNSDKRLQSIDIYANGQRLRSYELHYQLPGQTYTGSVLDDPARISRLESIELCYANPQGCASPLTLDWTSAATDDFVPNEANLISWIEDNVPYHYWVNGEIPDDHVTNFVGLPEPGYRISHIPYQTGGTVRGDFNGDGLKELALWECTSSPNRCVHYVHMSEWEPRQHIAESEYSFGPYGPSYGRYSGHIHGGVMDFNNDGVDDYYITSTYQEAGIRVYLSDGTKLNYSAAYSIPYEEIAPPITITVNGQTWTNKSFPFYVEMRDMNGDGLVDLFLATPVSDDPTVATLQDSGETGIYVALNTGSGWGPYERWGTATDYLTERKVNYADFGGRKFFSTQRLVDVNGDGLPDKVGFLPGYPIEVGINTGNGFLPPNNWTSTPIPTVINSPPYYGYKCDSEQPNDIMASIVDKVFRLGDFNGDNMADIAYLKADGLYVALSNGSGFEPAFRWSNEINLEKALCGSAYYPPDGIDDTGTFFGRYRWSAFDVNFDGKSDIKIKIERTKTPREEDIHGVLYSRSKPDAVNQGFSQMRVMYVEPFDYDTDHNRIKHTDSYVTEQGELIFTVAHSRQDHDLGGGPINYLRSMKSFQINTQQARLIGVHEGASRSILPTYEPLNRNTALYTQSAQSGGYLRAVDRNRTVSYSGFEGERFLARNDQTKPTAENLPKVVASVEVELHEAEQHTTTYRYKNHRIHSSGYGSLGFEQVEESTRYPAEYYGIRTITEYLQKATPDYMLSGKVARQLRCAVSGSVAAIACDVGVTLADERYRWKVRTYSDDIDSGRKSPHYFPFVYESGVEKRDLDDTSMGTARFLAYETGSPQCAQIPIGLTKTATEVSWRGYGGDSYDNYDADGVLPYSTKLSCGSSPGSEQSLVQEQKRLLDIDSVKSASRWLLGLVGREEITAATGKFLATIEAQQTRTTNFTYYDSGPHQGRLLTKTIEPDIQDLRLTTEYEYNAYGSISRESESWTDLASDGLDFTSREILIGENYLANGDRKTLVTNPLGHVTQKVFDARFGLASSETDANNLTTTYIYDELGREQTVTYPDDTQTVSDYATCSGCLAFEPAAAWFKQLKHSGESARRVYFDSLDREVGTQSAGLNGEHILTHKTYSSRGNLASHSEPFTGSASQSATSYQYDLLDRVTLKAFSDGSLERNEYHGPKQVVENGLNQITRRTFNGAGWVMRVEDDAGTPVEFSYTPFGELKTTMVDNQASTLVEIDYDNLGRKTFLDDPDAGLIAYEYNPLGLLAREINSEGQVTQNHYDKLGRLKKRIDDATATGSALRTHEWVYDNKQNGKGLLGTLSGYNTDGTAFVEEYTYDPQSRRIETETGIDSEVFTTKFYFDDLNRSIGTEYPSGYLIAKLYNNYGHLSKIQEAATGEPLWEANTGDERLNITQFTLGSGVVTYQLFDPATGRIDTKATYDGTTPIQDQEYEFDVLGNLRQRNDYVFGLTQDFCYDNLNRLVAARFSGCSALDQDFTYDLLGNLLTKEGVSGSYQYGVNGAGPHAVTQADGLTYEYDLNGNMVAARSDGTLVKSVEYSSFKKPTYLSGNGNWSRIAYGPHKKRVTREDSSGRKTIYVGRIFEQVTDNGVEEQVHYLGDFGMYVVRSGSSSEAYKLYTHRDHIGSVVARSKDSGAPELMSYDSWGLRLDQNWEGTAKGPGFKPEASSRGFTDHEHLDGVGLIHMNGRVYSPSLGRFLSPDPYIQAPTNTQSYNRYSYVWNNPLSYTDPTGEIVWVPIIWGAIELTGWAITAYNAYELGRTAGEIHNEIESGEKTVGEVLDERKVEIAIEVGAMAAGPVVKGAEKLIPKSVQDRLTSKVADVVESRSTRNAGGVDNADSLSVVEKNVTKNAPDITTPYKRPSGATTKAQRESVQNQPCVDCGNIANRQVADHKTPLVKEYYETGTIDKANMRGLDAVQPQCPTCSARQGAEMSRYSKQQKQDLGL